MYSALIMVIALLLVMTPVIWTEYRNVIITIPIYSAYGALIALVTTVCFGMLYILFGAGSLIAATGVEEYLKYRFARNIAAPSRIMLFMMVFAAVELMLIKLGDGYYLASMAKRSYYDENYLSMAALAGCAAMIHVSTGFVYSSFANRNAFLLCFLIHALYNYVVVIREFHTIFQQVGFALTSSSIAFVISFLLFMRRRHGRSDVIHKSLSEHD